MAAILFDIGGPILPEEKLYEAYLGTVKSALRDAGTPVSDGEFDAAVERCILSFVPSLTKAVAWQFTKPDAERCLSIVAEARTRFGEWSRATERTLRPGIAGLIESLSGRHKLALAANASGYGPLGELGLLRWFESVQVSGDLDFAKPDPRFFLHILGNLGAQPEDAIMIGDRLDNDIVPAKMLGMKAILFRTGPYAILEPRTPDEVPDAEVETIDELADTLSLCNAMGGNTRPPA